MNTQVSISLPSRSGRSREAYHEIAWFSLLSPEPRPFELDLGPIVGGSNGGEDGKRQARDHSRDTTLCDVGLEAPVARWGEKGDSSRGQVSSIGSLTVAEYVAHYASTPTYLLPSLLDFVRVDPEWGENGRIELSGGCGSDLFLVCLHCKGDRIVIEVKGPTAQINFSHRKNAYQTETYESSYSGGEGSCTCFVGTPKFAFLDARNRSAELLEATHDNLCLENWIVVGYRDLLGDTGGGTLEQWLRDSRVAE